MNIYTITLTARDSYFCEKWLSSWRFVVTHLTRADLTEGALSKLVRYEATTRKRDDVLKRLTGRYSKLRRKREWQELQEFMYGKTTIREDDRKVLSI